MPKLSYILVDLIETAKTEGYDRSFLRIQMTEKFRRDMIDSITGGVTQTPNTVPTFMGIRTEILPNPILYGEGFILWDDSHVLHRKLGSGPIYSKMLGCYTTNLGLPTK